MLQKKNSSTLNSDAPGRAKNYIFLLFCLANITISFNFAALAAAVPVMSKDLGASAFTVSQISAFYMIPYGLGALIYAPLARRVHLKVILIAGMGLYAFLNLVSALVHSIHFILAARVIMGLAAACVIPLSLIYIGTVFPKENRGRLVGLFFSTSFIASILGLVLSGICRWQWLFVVPGILAGITVVLVFFSKKDLWQTDQIGKVNYRAVWSNEQIRNVFIFIFAISFLYHGVHKWLGVYLDREYGLHQLAISLFFILIAVFGAIGQNFGGYLTDTRGRFAACYLGVIILSCSTMLLWGKYTLPVLGLTLALFSVGWTIGHNGVSTVLTDFPDEYRAEIASLNSAIRFVSGGLGFFIGGPFIEQNFGLTFLGFGVLMFISSFFLKTIIPQSPTVRGERYVES